MGKISDDRICHCPKLSQPEAIENYDATSCSDYDVRYNIVSKATWSQNYSVVDPAGNSLLLSSSLSHNNLRRARKVVEVGELNVLPFWNFSSK